MIVVLLVAIARVAGSSRLESSPQSSEDDRTLEEFMFSNRTNKFVYTNSQRSKIAAPRIFSEKKIRKLKRTNTHGPLVNEDDIKEEPHGRTKGKVSVAVENVDDEFQRSHERRVTKNVKLDQKRFLREKIERSNINSRIELKEHLADDQGKFKSLADKKKELKIDYDRSLKKIRLITNVEERLKQKRELSTTYEEALAALDQEYGDDLVQMRKNAEKNQIAKKVQNKLAAEKRHNIKMRNARKIFTDITSYDMNKAVSDAETIDSLEELVTEFKNVDIDPIGTKAKRLVTNYKTMMKLNAEKRAAKKALNAAMTANKPIFVVDLLRHRYDKSVLEIKRAIDSEKKAQRDLRTTLVTESGPLEEKEVPFYSFLERRKGSSSSSWATQVGSDYSGSARTIRFEREEETLKDKIWYHIKSFAMIADGTDEEELDSMDRYGRAKALLIGDDVSDDLFVSILDLLNPLGIKPRILDMTLPYVVFLHHIVSAPTIAGMWLATHALGKMLNIDPITFEEVTKKYRKKLAEAFRSVFKDKKETLKTESLSGAVEHCRRLFNTIMNSKAIITLVGFFTSIVSWCEFDEDITGKIFKYLGNPPKRNLADLVNMCLDAIKVILRVGEAVWSGSPVSEVLFAPEPNSSFLNHAADLLFYKDKLYVGKPVSNKMEESAFYNKAEQLIKIGDDLVKKGNPLIHPLGTIRKFLIELREAKHAIESGAGANRMRIPPVVIVLHGPPGIGKTSIMNFLMRCFCAERGIEFDPNMVFHKTMDTAFWEGIKAFQHRILHLSELGTMAANLAKSKGDPNLEMFTSLVDGNPICVNMAFNDKGKTYIEPWLIIIDTNEPTMNVELIKNNPAAILRRPIFIEPRVKEEFCKAGSPQLDVAKSLAHESETMDRWYFNVYRYIAHSNTEYTPHPIKNDIDIYGLASCMYDEFAEHTSLQAQVLKNMGKLDDLAPLMRDVQYKKTAYDPELFDPSPFDPKIEDALRGGTKENIVTQTINNMSDTIRASREYLEKQMLGATFKDEVQSIASLGSIETTSSYETDSGCFDGLMEEKFRNYGSEPVIAQSGSIEEKSQDFYHVARPSVNRMLGNAFNDIQPNTWKESLCNLLEFILSFGVTGFFCIALLIMDAALFVGRVKWPWLSFMFRGLFFLILARVLFYGDFMAGFLLMLLVGFYISVDVAKEVLNKRTRSSFAKWKSRIYAKMNVLLSWNPVSSVYDSAWWRLYGAALSAALLGVSMTIAVMVAGEALGDYVFEKKHKVKKRFYFEPMDQPDKLRSEISTDFKDASPVDAELKQLEKDFGCGKSYERIAVKNTMIWNDRDIISREKPSHTSSVAELYQHVNKNLRFCQVMRNTTQKTFILGLKGNVALINTHALGPNSIELKVSTLTGGRYENCAWYSSIITPSVRVDLGNDITLVCVQGIKFRDITQHLINYPMEERVCKAIFNEVELVASPRIAHLPVTDPNGHSFIIEESWLYVYPKHAPGMCGSPLVVNINGGSALVGIHAAGSLAEDAYATALQKDAILTGVNQLTSKSNLMPVFSEAGLVYSKLESPIMKSMFRYEDLRGIQYLGKKPGPVIENQRSKLKESGIGDDIHEILVMHAQLNLEKRFSRPMMMHQGSGDKFISPWNQGIKKMAGDRPGLDMDVLNYCVKELADRVIKAIGPEQLAKVAPLDIETAINSTTQDEYLRRMNAATAAGATLGGKKKDHIPEISEGNRQPTPELREHLKRLLEYYKKGEMVPSRYEAKLKDEVRELEKCKTGNTRIFYSGDLPNIIVARMFLGPLFTLMYEHGDAFGTAVGINIFRGGHELINKLRKFSPYIMEGDYGKFDVKMPPAIAWAAASFWTLIAQACNYSVEALLCLMSVLSGEMFPIIEVLLDIIWAIIQPSGKYGTAEDNSIRGVLMLMYAFYKMRPQGNTCSFFDGIKPDTFGDDMLAAVMEQNIGWFNNITYQKFCREVFKLEFTTAGKGSEMRPYLAYDEVSFLKRRFVWDDKLQRFKCPLETDSLFKMMSWFLPSDFVTDEEQLIATFHSFCWELTIHLDPVRYNDVTSRVAKAISKKRLYGRPLVIPDYFDYQARMYGLENHSAMSLN